MKRHRPLVRLNDSWPKPPIEPPKPPEKFSKIPKPISFANIKVGDLIYVKCGESISSNFFARVTEKKTDYFIAKFTVEWTAKNTKQKFISNGGFNHVTRNKYFIFDKRYKHPNE